jgi:oligopeptide/dipeptide ABC transporter ATP-binding protein
MYRGRVVELGPTREVFETPRHGYTVALLRAHPGRHRYSAAASPRRTATEDAPAFGEPGCPFQHKCAFRVDECKIVTPVAVHVSDTRFAECLVLPYLSPADVREALAATGISHHPSSG